MNLGLFDKIILVAGGAGGIGQAVCAVLHHDEGAKVVSLDAKVVPVVPWRQEQVDLSDWLKVQELFRDLRARVGMIAGFCSLVYAGGGDERFSEVRPHHLKHQFEGTFLAALYPAQAAAKWMSLSTEGGNIVIVSSVNSVLGLNECPYDFAKGAVNRIAPDIIADCGEKNISAVTLLPGTICGTPSWEGKEEWLKNIASAIPDHKVTTAREVGNTIAFLLSHHGKMFSGSTIVADRGWSLRPVFKR